MPAEICWNCDFCGKSGITVSKAGILHCPHCCKSYGKKIDINSFVGSLAMNIRDEVFDKLEEIYNHRKAKEGLVSLHNQLIEKLKKKINEWVAEEYVEEESINKEEQK